MALTFHSGFETGDFAEWSSTTGSPTVQSGIKKTGTYAMRCNTAAASAYADSGKTACRQISFWFYIATAPDAMCVILGQFATFNLRLFLTTDRYLELYYVNELKGTGTTQLQVGQWYRISVANHFVNEDATVYLDGNSEITTTDAGNLARFAGVLGVGTAVTADLYFDDLVVGPATDTLDDLGDIRVAVSLPNADGTNQDFGADETGTTRPFYDSVDELTSGTPDNTYVWYDDRVQQADSEETFALQNSATIGLAAGDTIEAVNVIVRMKRSTGGGSAHQIVEYDTANTETTQALTTSYVTYQKYRGTAPTSGAWSQAIFDAYEVGAGNANDGGQDTYISCVNVMVAYRVAAGGVTVTPGTATLTATRYVPVVTVTNNVVVTPSTAALTITRYIAAVILGTVIVPATASLAVTAYIPTVTSTNNITVIPGIATLTLTVYVPIVTASDNKTVIPGTVALTITGYVPIVSTAENIEVIPGAASLVTATFIPIVSLSENIIIIPGTASFTTNLYTPNVILGSVAIPGTLGLNLTPYTPAIILGTIVTCGTTSLVTTNYVPSVTASENIVVIPGMLSVVVTLYVPSVVLSENIVVIPGTAALTLSPYTSVIVLGTVITPPTVSLVTTTYSPTILISENVVVIPGTTSLTTTFYIPTVAIGGIIITPGIATLIITRFTPVVIGNIQMTNVKGFETSEGIVLVSGIILDGQYLKRSGSRIVGSWT